MVPDLIRTRNRMDSSAGPIKEVTNMRTFCDIINELSMSKEMFSEVIRPLKIFYTIPVTTSTAERTFSALRRLKTYLRSTMSQARLNHTKLIYVHKERTDDVVIDMPPQGYTTCYVYASRVVSHPTSITHPAVKYW